MSAIDPADVFRTEADELLDRLEATLLDLGDRPDDRGLVDTAFRALHTIKGSGAMFGFEQVAAFTHDFETAFDLVRQGRVQASVDLVNVSLSAKDYIRALIETPDETDAIIGQAILDELQRLVDRASDGGDRTDAPSATAAIPAASPVPAVTGGWRIGIAFDPAVLRNGTNPLGLLDDLRELGPCSVSARLNAIPELAALDPVGLALAWDLTLSAPVSREAVEDVFMFVIDEMTLSMTPLEDGAAPLPETSGGEPVDARPEPNEAGREPSAPVPTAPVPPATRGPSDDRPTTQRRAEDKPAGSTVRVQAERLDELMDRVGELVIAQARLSQLVDQRTDSGMKGIAEEIERLASGLRDATMGIRMVPIGSLFSRFRRLVHDLSRDLAKPVDFVTVGEDTELDKTMIERLADPLVHLIRNAIDHGIEDAANRAASGKDASGRIELRAEHSGAQVTITVRDDGAGLDAARIRAKAEENGIVVPGAAMSDQEIYQLIFAPGFSTAKTISTLSGRGVGMDVVKRAIEAMRGTIDLSTTIGRGSEVVLRLPLTLAIIEGLLIRVGSGRYVIPLSAVEECVELPKPGARAQGGDFLNIRGDLVPFLSLRDLFEADGEPDAHQKIIVTSTGGERVGFVADQIIGSHQTVIKSLSKLHAGVTMFSGATILGDGSAALILDVPHVVAARHDRHEPVQEAA